MQSALTKAVDWCEIKEKNSIITLISGPLGTVLDFVTRTKMLIKTCFNDLKVAIPDRNWSKYINIFDNLTH